MVIELHRRPALPFADQFDDLVLQDADQPRAQRRLAAEAGPAIPRGDQRVQIALRGSAPLHADRRLVQRALNNLFANAMHHAPTGSTVDAWVEATPAGVNMNVSNSGPGIAAGHLPRLFDRFYQTDPSRPDSAESNGLGLAIVQSIMRMHGGIATATSTPAGVTTFTLRFVATQPEPDRLS